MAASNTGFTQNRLGQSKNPIDSDHGLPRPPAVQEESDYQRSVRVRSCIRPLSAAVWPLALM